MVLPDEPEPEDDEEDEYDFLELATMEVLVTEPQLLGTLLGPDGEVIAAMYDRRIIPFGFQQ